MRGPAPGHYIRASARDNSEGSSAWSQRHEAPRVCPTIPCLHAETSEPPKQHLGPPHSAKDHGTKLEGSRSTAAPRQSPNAALKEAEGMVCCSLASLSPKTGSSSPHHTGKEDGGSIQLCRKGPEHPSTFSMVPATHRAGAPCHSTHREWSFASRPGYQQPARHQ